MFSRLFRKSDQSKVEQAPKHTTKKSTYALKTVPIEMGEDVEMPPLTSSFSSKISFSDTSSSDTNSTAGNDYENNANTLTAPEQELPYDKYVTLTPEQRKFHCQTRIMAHEIKYSMVTAVTNSWEQDLKVIPNWEKIGGDCLLRKIFELEPDSIRMIGFLPDTKFDDPALSTNEKFVKTGIAVVVMLDTVLSLLGPDLEPLEEQLIELGRRHVARQCKPKHWPMVGVALFYTLQTLLGDKFTKDVQDCWIVLYNFLGYHMIQGLIQNGGPTWEDN